MNQEINELMGRVDYLQKTLERYREDYFILEDTVSHIQINLNNFINNEIKMDSTKSILMRFLALWDKFSMSEKYNQFEFEDIRKRLKELEKQLKNKKEKI